MVVVDVVAGGWLDVDCGRGGRGGKWNGHECDDRCGCCCGNLLQVKVLFGFEVVVVVVVVVATGGRLEVDCW